MSTLDQHKDIALDFHNWVCSINLQKYKWGGVTYYTPPLESPEWWKKDAGNWTVPMTEYEIWEAYSNSVI